MAGRFFVTEPKYKFIERRMLAFVVSAVFIIGSVVALSTRGLNFGIDFTGGVLIDVQLPAPDTSDVSACEAGGAGGAPLDASACARASETLKLQQVNDIRLAIDALGYDSARVQRAQDSQRPNAVLIRVRANVGEGLDAERAEQSAGEDV